jgi:adenylate cyclase
MPQEGFKRKLTAILSADAVGYSRLMRDNEEATVRDLAAHRALITEIILQHNGRVIDSPGDNLLAEFASVVDAINGAIKIQDEINKSNSGIPEDRHMKFRIGINLGDVIEEEGRIYGDGVNIAARVEGLAAGGGIAISGTVYEHIKEKLSLGYHYLGEQDVKNISEPVRVYRLLTEPADAGKMIGEKKPKSRKWLWACSGAIALIILVIGAIVIWNYYFRPSFEPASVEKMAYPLPEKPSIAVLPFDNMSGDPEQEYFSDGLTEELITALSKTPKMFVIARNSTFTYKGKPVKVKQVAEELGVRYVLEGSVRKAEDRVRITAQLIDALTGHHLWAERYDRDLKDIFALQDEITMKILTALQVKLTEGDQARLAARGTKDLHAYLKYLQGRDIYLRINKEDNAAARHIFKEVIAIDPKFAPAWSILGSTYWMDVFLGSSKSPKDSIKKAIELQQKAIALDETGAADYAGLGWLYALTGRHEEAIAEIERAIELAPNNANAYTWMGYVLRVAGRNDEAIHYSEQALRLNPIPPSWYFRGIALNYLYAHRYNEAIDMCKKALKRAPNDLLTHVTCAAIYGQAGHADTAQLEVEEVLRLNPKFSALSYAKRLPYKNQSDRDFYLDAMRKGGLPE